MQTQQPLTGLARRLVKDGVFSPEVARGALEKARTQNTSFINHIVAERLVSPHRAASAASDEFGLPLLDLDAFDIASVPAGLVPEAMITQYQIIPLAQRDGRLYIALTDPANIKALDAIKFHTGTMTEGIVVEEGKLQRFIDAYMDANSSAIDGLDDADLDGLDVSSGEEEQTEETSEEAAQDAPIVRFVNKMLLDCIKKGASDIHFEPYELSYRVRSRIDGILQEIAKPPKNLSSQLSARLKVMSKMDISEKRLPQDGRIKLKISKTRTIDFRVNTLPTLWGEKIVLRILDPASAKMGVDALGFNPQQKDAYMTILHQPQGMILVTGPTGSGKTVSLYTGLNILNTAERNISTAEDPVEINLEGINQVHVNAKVGLTFAEALRSFLRQDPDVVMVGEIRDLETAEIGIKAAQTGHMVLSTLHTNSAPETLTRLRNMGVPSFNIATSVSLIIAQRLARRLCTACKKPVTIPEQALKEEGFTQAQLDMLDMHEANPEGCPKCNKGFKGRVGIYEMLTMTPEIAEVIMSDGNSLDILKTAKGQGFRTMRETGLDKVAEGITSLEELDRVIKV